MKLLMIMVLTALASSAWAKQAKYEPGDFIIKFKPGTMEFVSALSNFSQGGGEVEVISDNMVHLKVAPSRLLSFDSDVNVLQKLNAAPEVEYAQPNYILSYVDQYIQSPQVIDLVAKNYGTENLMGWGEGKPRIPGAVLTPMFGPDPLLAQQWAMKEIHADAAWKVQRGSKKVIVAVIDTGVDYTHEDLAGNMWHNPKEIPDNGIDDDGNGYVDDVVGWDFVDNDNKPYDVATGPLGTVLLGGNPGHGTHCAGTIGAVGGNSKGISGVAPVASIMALRFLDWRGQGVTSNAVKAINYAVQNGAKVLSNSWGSEGEETGNEALQDAIKNAKDKNVLFVAAAGNGRMGFGYDNDKDAKPNYPSSYNYDNIVSVAAVDREQGLAKFSNWGPKTVHIAAPGVGILSTVVKNQYADAIVNVWDIFKLNWEGTSMATPFVAGAAALVWAQHPGYKYSEVKAKLLSSVTKIPGLETKVASGGELNVEAALK